MLKHERKHAYRRLMTGSTPLDVPTDNNAVSLSIAMVFDGFRRQQKLTHSYSIERADGFRKRPPQRQVALNYANRYYTIFN